MGLVCDPQSDLRQPQPHIGERGHDAPSRNRQLFAEQLAEAAAETPTSSTPHLEAVGPAVEVHVHDGRRAGAARRRQRLFPVRQREVAEFAMRFSPALFGKLVIVGTADIW